VPGMKPAASPRTRLRRLVRRPRLKPLAERNPITFALVGLITMALVGLLAYNADSLPVVGGGTSYTAEFKEAAGLKSGDEVRVAGVRVGEVKSVALDGARVEVTFKVKDAWIGDRSTVGIAIKTLLGSKYLAVDPLGSRRQDPGKRIPAARTTSPYDVMRAFDGLSRTVGELDKEKIADSLEAITTTFQDTPPHVQKAMKGLSDLSRTISTRNDDLAELLSGTAKFTRTVNGKKDEFESFLKNGNLLLQEVRNRRDSLHALFIGTRALSTQLTGLIDDNAKQLGPTLASLDRVTDVIARNKKHLDKALAAAGPYYRLVGNALGNGRWMDAYLCGLVPKDYLPAQAASENGCLPPKKKAGDR
jgi:phospholipid/cholesterol/gamma-HCH transport system substrate-binding protein